MEGGIKLQVKDEQRLVRRGRLLKNERDILEKKEANNVF